MWVEHVSSHLFNAEWAEDSKGEKVLLKLFWNTLIVFKLTGEATPPWPRFTCFSWCKNSQAGHVWLDKSPGWLFSWLRMKRALGHQGTGLEEEIVPRVVVASGRCSHFWQFFFVCILALLLNSQCSERVMGIPCFRANGVLAMGH